MADDLERDDSPVGKLVNAILLSSLNQQASDIAIRRVEGQAVVDFLIDGVEVREMRPPSALHDHLVRRLRVMASIPYYARGQRGEGRLVLLVASTRRVEFSVMAEGHGEELAIYLRRIYDG
jgi:type II secretory ATPase GspE/PulE/Tfp pilus assembly ATPase PilB-like protein